VLEQVEFRLFDLLEFYSTRGLSCWPVSSAGQQADGSTSSGKSACRYPTHSIPVIVGLRRMTINHPPKSRDANLPMYGHCFNSRHTNPVISIINVASCQPRILEIQPGSLDPPNVDYATSVIPPVVWIRTELLNVTAFPCERKDHHPGQSVPSSGSGTPRVIAEEAP
jgi:hypothetical protein